MLKDIVELKMKMFKLRAIFTVEFCYNLATIAGDCKKTLQNIAARTVVVFRKNLMRWFSVPVFVKIAGF